MKKTLLTGFATGLFLFGMVGMANSTTFTMTSNTSEGLLPTGITEIGGLVLDLVGSNGTRVVSQLSASSLYVGYFGTTPGTIGTQTGFDQSAINALGGGIAEASLRLTVWDGDTASGDFDWQRNDLLLNGIDFGDFSDVETDATDTTGTISYGTELGFADGSLNTGFFYNNDATTMSSLFSSLTSGSVVFALQDVDPNDNFFDFTQGLDGSLINIGTGPVITPPNNPVPEPSTVLLMGAGLIGLLGYRRKRFSKNAK